LLIYEDVVGKWPKLNSVFAAVEAVAAVVTVGTICVATAATVGITKTILAVKNQKKKEVVLLPKEKDLKREKLRKKPQNEQIKPRIQL
jgi:hypothetical protein